jgi:hypothetical protein
VTASRPLFGRDASAEQRGPDWPSSLYNDKRIATTKNELAVEKKLFRQAAREFLFPVAGWKSFSGGMTALAQIRELQQRAICMAAIVAARAGQMPGARAYLAAARGALAAH